jgi:hypothetical protein
MLNQLKALLGNGQLCQQLKTATSLEEAISLIKTADVGQAHQVSEGLSTLAKTSFESLSEKDLLAIAGGWESQFPLPTTEIPTCTFK